MIRHSNQHTQTQTKTQTHPQPTHTHTATNTHTRTHLVRIEFNQTLGGHSDLGREHVERLDGRVRVQRREIRAQKRVGVDHLGHRRNQMREATKKHKKTEQGVRRQSNHCVTIRAVEDRGD
jgi:hypothetical protein